VFSFKHHRWGEHLILETKERAEEYKSKYGVEAALRLYEDEYAKLCRLFDYDTLVAFTCINLLTPEQMDSLESKLNERSEKLKKERNDESN
jgi:hypothetical protein